MATTTEDKAAKIGARASGALVVAGAVIALVGVALMATVAATVPGVILLVMGLAWAGFGMVGARSTGKKV